MNILFRIFKYISIILITFSLFMGINFIDNNSYATNTKLYEVARIVDPTVNQNAYKVKKAYDNEKVNNAVGKILGTIRNIGIIISVIVLMIIGIKYMLGSVEEKANYKETLLPYLIGDIILLAGTVIPDTIYKIVK